MNQKERENQSWIDQNSTMGQAEGKTGKGMCQSGFSPKVYFDPPLWTESGGCEDKGASLWLYNRSFVFAWRSKTIYFSINSFLQEYSEIRNVFSAASNC